MGTAVKREQKIEERGSEWQGSQEERGRMRGDGKQERENHLILIG